MNNKRPMFWHQGLFLQPQHFQYADGHHSWSANALARHVRPHHWGVIDLAINEARLASGVLELERATLLFRDGTLVELPDNAVIAQRDFRSNWPNEQGHFTAYIGVRRLAATDANVTVVTDRDSALTVNTRYASLADAEQMPDLHQGGGSGASVMTLHYVLRLFWENELEDIQEYELLPIARLVRDGDTVQLDGQHAPPSLTVAAAPTLLRLLREIREDVIGRVHQLEEYKGTAGASPEFSPKVVRYRLALQATARYAALLTHYTESPQIHPFEAYGLLRQLVSEVSAFTPDVDVMGTPAGQSEGLPAYDHQHAGRCFREARSLTEKLLNSITVGPELMVGLEQTHPGRFEAELPREFLERRAVLYLVLRTDSPFEPLLDSFMNYAKLGAAAAVETYVQRALPGVSASYLRVRPESLPQRPDATYFKLERGEERWEDVENQRSLVLLWDDAPEDLRVELVMVRR